MGPTTKTCSATEAGRRPNWEAGLNRYTTGIIGLLVGGLIGYWMRPSAFLIGKLPLATVITRGALLQGLDQLLVPLAESSFNYIVVGALLGAIAGAIYGHIITTRRTPAGGVSEENGGTV